MDSLQFASPCLRRTALMLAFALVAAPASAQLAQQAFRIAIDRFGGDRCESIKTTRPLGTGSNGDTLVAVACTNSGQHVVSIHQDNSVSYMTSCPAFEARTGIACFDGQTSAR